MKKVRSVQDWKQLGLECKVAERFLHDILERAVQFDIPKKTTEDLVKALEKISRFKSRCEDRMLSNNECERKNFMDIFYGNAEPEITELLNKIKNMVKI
jgi:hypothetical protein